MNTDIKDLIFNASAKKGAEDRAKRIALQERLQRFAGSFEDRIAQVSYFLEQEFPNKIHFILRQHLLYTTSAIEIATGPSPEVDLLDMLTFAHLCGDRVASYWIPQEYGEHGKPLLNLFHESEDQLWEIVDLYSKTDIKARVLAVWDRWKKSNPDQILVERVRLAEVAGVRGAQELERVAGLSGLFHGMKEALSAADESLLMANRALFFGQHLATLARLEVRLGAVQVVHDGLSNLSSVQDKLSKLQKESMPFLGESNKLLKNSAGAAAEANKLLTLVGEKISLGGQNSQLIPDTISMLKTLNENIAKHNFSAQKIIKATRSQIAFAIWNVAFAVMAVFAFAAVLWWLLRALNA